MKFVALILGVLGGLFSQAFSQDLSALRVVLEGGRVNPWGDLAQKVDAAYFGNAGLSYAYAPGLGGYAQGGYAYLPVTSPDFAGLHQMNGRAGLEISPSWMAPLSVGGGISLLFVRGDEKTAAAQGYMLYDNESEFGWHARLTLPVVRKEYLQVGFRAWWEEVWTQPDASQLMWLGLYVEAGPW